MAEIMNRGAVLAVRPYRESEAMSLKEIAMALDMDTTTYADWIRASRNLARVLRILINWRWVAFARRQRTDGNKFWHNVYWRIEFAVQPEINKRQKTVPVRNDCSNAILPEDMGNIGDSFNPSINSFFSLMLTVVRMTHIAHIGFCYACGFNWLLHSECSESWFLGEKCPLKPFLLSVIDCLGCDEYMNKLNYIKVERVRNNFRTPKENEKIKK